LETPVEEPGRWTARAGEGGAGTRDINAHGVGNKRRCGVASVAVAGCRPGITPSRASKSHRGSARAHEARRCRELIRTLPALNDDLTLSPPRMPEWLDQGMGKEVEDREEQEEFAAGFE
jgi:hypothetical protein